MIALALALLKRGRQYPHSKMTRGRDAGVESRGARRGFRRSGGSAYGSGFYAIGDVNAVPMANGWPLPKAGVFASSEGETVGRNIAAAIVGTEPAEFPGVGHCFIACSGAQAGKVKGEFLSEGKPRVSLQPATARGFRAKERFERDGRRFRI